MLNHRSTDLGIPGESAPQRIGIIPSRRAGWISRFLIPNQGWKLIQDGKRRRFAMGQAIGVRVGISKRARSVGLQAGRGMSVRRVGCWRSLRCLMVRRAQRRPRLAGWTARRFETRVIRFNEHGPDGLINLPSPGAPSKLDREHRAFLARIVDEGPIPAIHGVVRWRACDLIMRLHEEFGISVSDDTVYRALKDLGFAHVTPGPGPTSRMPMRSRHLKKLRSPCGGNPSRPCARNAGRSLVPGRIWENWPEEQAHLSLGQKRGGNVRSFV